LVDEAEIAPKRKAAAKAPRAAKPAAKAPARAKKTASVPKPAASKARKAVRPKSPAKAARSKAPAKGSWKPAKYGETQVVAFIRDPNCIFVYWEIAAQKLEQVQKELKGEYAKSRLVLRMFRSREDGQADLIYEIEVSPEDMNRYLPVHEPGRGYYVEVARKTASGKVVVLARSNALSTPTAGFSPLVDRAWTPAPALEEYLTEELEVGPDQLPAPGALGGVSSAEAQRRRRKFLDTFSSFGSPN
ncbi:MAG TPA: DUF4912 domain-containing protein, partial [bacterium]|nr:DUF4912 domain-containing protein [bacterium]